MLLSSCNTTSKLIIHYNYTNICFGDEEKFKNVNKWIIKANV